MAEAFEGGCLCGAVRFRAEGAPNWTAYCHCDSCRRHSGAPVSTFVAYERAAVVFTTVSPNYYASSPGVRRGFCARCGATLTCEGEARPSEIHIHVGAFDTPSVFAPTFHIFPEERLTWLHVTDPDLPTEAPRAASA